MWFGFGLTAAIFSAAALRVIGAIPHTRQSSFCAEATQYGILIVSPSTVSPGDTLNVNANLTCAINSYGHYPEYIDYYIGTPLNSNGSESLILLARRTLQTGSLSHLFTAQVPDAYYVANASHSVMMFITYATNGPTGVPYFIVGGTEAGIDINF